MSKHFHSYFIDSDSNDEYCRCGKKKVRGEQDLIQLKCRTCGVTYLGSRPYYSLQGKFCSFECSLKSRRSKSKQQKTQTSSLVSVGKKRPRILKFGIGGAGSYPNVQRGDYENSKGTMYFRSKWEANYALYLDFLKDQGQIKDWEYETDTFVFEKIKFGTRSYRPDFKVFNPDGSFEYHEIKGYMDGRSKTKLRRMVKYYPEIKLILVDKDSYTEIKKKLGKMLLFY